MLGNISYIYMYIYTHIYIHTHTYIYICIFYYYCLEIFCYQLYQASQSLYFNVTLKVLQCFSYITTSYVQIFLFLGFVFHFTGNTSSSNFLKKGGSPTFGVLIYFDPYLNIQILVRLRTVLCSKYFSLRTLKALLF